MDVTKRGPSALRGDNIFVVSDTSVSQVGTLLLRAMLLAFYTLTSHLTVVSCFRGVLEFSVSKRLIFLSSFEALEGLERSGRLVG